MSRAACDVLVIGSGVGGLSAAVVAAHHGLDVVVAEKSEWIGGTSAWSGGWLWIPGNPLAQEAGIDEPPEAPLTYLRNEIGNRVNDPRLAVFLGNGPDMVAFFRAHTAVEWIDGNRIPDFHASEGAAQGGRSVCARPYDGRGLGEWIDRLRPPLDLVSLWGMGIGSGADMAHFFAATRRPASALHVARRLARHMRDRVRHGRGMQLVNGNALVARLLRSALDLGVTVRTGAPAEELILSEGRVAGAVIAGRDLRARRGVVLATGGFPHDAARIAAMFEHAPTGREHHSAAPPENTGDGLRLAEAVGGTVAQDLASPGAWAPVSLVPRRDGSTGRFPHLVDRAKPGIIAVGPDGRRFVNEADSYHDFMSALFRTYPNMTSPHAWIVADSRARARYGLGWSKPFPFRAGPAVAAGYLKRGATWKDLAAACNLPAEVLADSVARFNAAAARGEDPEFRRGASPYNRVQGDAAHAPNPSLAPLTKPPFYAVRVVPGSLGTFAGLRTDAAARVLAEDGTPVPGLFAVGNDMASVMGGHYPSGGITMGPAMTFGYVAGRILAGQAVTGLEAEQAQQSTTGAST